MGCASAYFSELACSLDCDGAAGRNERNMYKLRSRPQAKVTEAKRIDAASDSRGRAMVLSS